MVRRPAEEEEDNPERWLVSYADFITLLFAFFVVMYSVSSVNQSKYQELSSSINIAFANDKPRQEASKPTVNNQAAQPKAEQAPALPTSAPTQALQQEVNAMSQLGKSLSNKLAPLIKQGNARVVQNSHGLRIDIKDSVLFTSGSADLIETAKAILSNIATPLLNSSHAILVEGHTDNTPIHLQNATFFSSWELSAVRASSVVGMFSDVGIENIRLSALGYGPSQPISSNNTDAGRAINRHVSIMVLYDSLNVRHNQDVEITPDPS